MKSQDARTTDFEKMPQTQGQTGEGQSQVSMDPDNMEMQEGETLLGQGEQPGPDVTKTEKERKNTSGKGGTARDSESAEHGAATTSGPDEVRTGRVAGRPSGVSDGRDQRQGRVGSKGARHDARQIEEGERVQVAPDMGTAGSFPGHDAPRKKEEGRYGRTAMTSKKMRGDRKDRKWKRKRRQQGKERGR